MKLKLAMKVWRPGHQRQKNGRTYGKVYGAENFCTEMPVPFCIFMYVWTENFTDYQRLSVHITSGFFWRVRTIFAFRVSGHLVFPLNVNFNFFVKCIKQLKGAFKQKVFKRKKRAGFNSNRIQLEIFQITITCIKKWAGKVIELRVRCMANRETSNNYPMKYTLTCPALII